jgi:hypothetical protein
MNLLDSMAEARIQEALERGELQGLAGEGKPLELDDDSLVPEELRAGYRLLKNAGFLPPELQALKELRQVESLLSRLEPDEPEHGRAQLRLSLLRSRLEGRHGSLAGRYEQRLVERFVR